MAVLGISVFTRKRHFWFVSLLFGVVGCVFLILAAIAKWDDRHQCALQTFL
jgi:hypothetical protein